MAEYKAMTKRVLEAIRFFTLVCIRGFAKSGIFGDALMIPEFPEAGGMSQTILKKVGRGCGQQDRHAHQGEVVHADRFEGEAAENGSQAKAKVAC